MAITSLERFSSLVELIYSASLTSSLWPEVIDRTRIEVGGSGAILFTPLHAIDGGGIAVSANLPETFIHEYATRHQKEDLFIKKTLEKGLTSSGTVLNDEDLVSRKELLASRFYCETMQPLDIGRLLFGLIFGLEAEDAQPTTLSIHRKLGAPTFPQRDKDTIRLLIPHLSRSLGIMYRLRDAEYRIATSLAALDRLASSLVLLDQRGGVLFVNRAAFTILQREDGLSLAREPGATPRIRGPNGTQTRAIEKAIAIALDHSQMKVPHFSQGVSIARPSGAPPIVINVAALPVGNEFDTGNQRPRAIAFLTDTAKSLRVDASLLCDLYTLTKAEAQVVSELCAGHSLKAIAKIRRVSEGTLRTQLKSVFRKTGTARQADLVKLALSLSPMS